MWHLNKEKLRVGIIIQWVVRIQGRGVKQVEARKGWAGSVPHTRGEWRKFKNSVLFSEVSPASVREGDNGDLEVTAENDWRK